MSGVDFEHYVTHLLTQQVYINVSLTEQYDYGVDIVADNDGVRWGIQVKRYAELVKAEVVFSLAAITCLYYNKLPFL